MMLRKRLRHSLATILSLLLMVGISFQSAVAQTPTADESRALEDYLRRLDLELIIVKQLEQKLARTLDAGERARLADRLARAYAAQLLNPQPAPESEQDIQKSAKRLIEIYPELENPLLRVAIHHATFQQVNLDFWEWWYSGGAPDLNQKVTEELRELVGDLLQLKRRVETRRKELALNAQFGNRTDLSGMENLENLENVLMHTQYLIGWTSYFRSIIEREDRRERLETSEHHFREFLQIEPEKVLMELTVSWFDFDSGWTARGLIGLALCKQAQGQPDASQKCFDLLSQANQEKLDQIIPIWKLKGLLLDQQIQQALSLARSLEKSASTRLESRVRFWETAARGGLSLSSSESHDASRLIQLAFLGLMRDKQVDMIRRLIDEHNIRLPEDNFLGNWVAGYLLFVDAELTHDRDKFRLARERLEKALSVAPAETNEADKARCRFFLAWVHFRNRQFEKAEQEFQQVVNLLRTEDRAIAAQAHWYRIQSLMEISRKSPRETNAAFTAMDQMLRWFPDSAMTERIEFEKMKLNLRSLPDDEAVSRLQTISRDRVSYVDVLYDLVQRQYRVWLSATQRGPPDQAAFDKLSQWEREYRIHPDSTAARRLRAMLLVIDAQLRRNNSDESLAVKELLEVATRFANQLGNTTSPLYLEYKYYNFLFAERHGSPDAEALANWLLGHARNTRYENSALVFLAQQSKQRMTNDQSTAEQLQPDIAVYRRLLEVSGDSDDALKKSSNSRIAAFQLALLYAETENWEDADELNQRLIDLFPRNPDFLLAAARVKMKLEQFESARAIWRILAGGVKAGEDVWYESKHQLAVCVARNATESALKLIRQTRQLSPGLPDKWKRSFDSLESSLNRQ